MKTLFFATAIFACLAQADDRTRDVQASLKSRGFFYGEADGKPSEVLSAATRRFQIRNGLKVTGEADEETIAALGLSSEKTPPPMEPETPTPKKTPQVNPSPVKPSETVERSKPRDLLVRQRERFPALESDERTPRMIPNDSAVVEPPRPIPNATWDPASSLFRGTPYAVAPRELQEDTIAAAQRILQRERAYRGEVDGFAGQMTSEALFTYQEKYAMRPTGRLDLDTLTRMNLLPRVVPAQNARPFYNPNQRHDRTVFRFGWHN